MLVLYLLLLSLFSTIPTVIPTPTSAPTTAATTYATVSSPAAIVFDSSNNLFVPLDWGTAIKKCAYVSSGTTTCSTAASTSGSWPRGVALDTGLNLYVMGDNTVLKFTYSSSYATQSTFATISGGANSAIGIYIDSNDNFYYAYGTTIYKCSGLSTTSCSSYFSGTLTLTSTEIYSFSLDKYNQYMFVHDISGKKLLCCTSTSSSSCYTFIAVSYTSRGFAFDSTNNLYMADYSNSKIWKYYTTIPTSTPSILPTIAQTEVPTVIPTVIPTVAPTKRPTVTPTTTPTVVPTVIPTTMPSATPTYVPTAVPSTITPTYYPSLSPHSISIITTIAGTGTDSFSGDGGMATSATISAPSGIVIDTSGNVYFCEYHNNRVRKITISTGIISTYAGTGSSSFSGDEGVASSAALARPNGLCIDTSGNIYACMLDIFSPLLLHQQVICTLGTNKIIASAR